MSETKTHETAEQKRERIRAANEARRVAMQKTAEAFRDLEEELEDKFSRDLDGFRGKDFEIVSSLEGPVVLRRTELVAYKAFMGSMKAADLFPSHEAQSRYVMGAVLFPESDKAANLFVRFPGLLTTCANVLMALHNGKAKDAEGK